MEREIPSEISEAQTSGCENDVSEGCFSEWCRILEFWLISEKWLMARWFFGSVERVVGGEPRW